MFVSVDFHFFSWTKTTTKGRANNKKLLDNFEGKVIKDFKSNKSWGLLMIIRLIIALIHLWPRWAVYFESLDACSQSCTGRRRRCWWGWSTRSACCCWAGQLRDFLDRLGWQEKWAFVAVPSKKMRQPAISPLPVLELLLEQPKFHCQMLKTVMMIAPIFLVWWCSAVLLHLWRWSENSRAPAFGIWTLAAILRRYLQDIFLAFCNSNRIGLFSLKAS